MELFQSKEKTKHPTTIQTKRNKTIVHFNCNGLSLEFIFKHFLLKLMQRISTYIYTSKLYILLHIYSVTASQNRRFRSSYDKKNRNLNIFVSFNIFVLFCFLINKLQLGVIVLFCLGKLLWIDEIRWNKLFIYTIKINLVYEVTPIHCYYFN